MGTIGSLLSIFAPLESLASAGGQFSTNAHEIFLQTALILALAVVLGFVGAKLKQPLIVSFIAVGILVGSHGLDIVKDTHSLELLSEIGIAILLFIVGLKLDLGMIRTMGRVSLATGLGQVLFTSVGGFLLAQLLGLDLSASIYTSVALTFSSTIIIVKLLSDKREIDALHGRIAIGFLIVQDLAVVLAMIALSAYGAGAASETSLAWDIAKVAISGIAFLGAVYMIMRLVLPWLLQHLARVPELLVLFAIAWSVGLATLGDFLGFSKEVGAFAAGISIASTPFRDAVGSRLVSLRDFLLLFFFIQLGSTLDLSILGGAVLPAVVFSVFVLVGNPLIVMTIMGYMGYRKRTGFLAGLTVAQISEFSLILIGLGASLGHVSRETVGLVTLVGLITIGLSTYMILYSGPLYKMLGPALSIFERKIPFREENPDEHEAQRLERVDVLVLGLGQYGSQVVRGLVKRGQKVVGVDFDPQNLRYWREHNLSVFYGDMNDPDLLEYLPIRHSRWVFSTVPNREANRVLVNLLRHAGYKGKLALAARTQADEDYYKALAVDLVLCPFADAADQAVDELNAAMHLMPEKDKWPTSLIEVHLETGAIWAGKPLGEIPLRSKTDVSVLAVSRAGKTTFDPLADFVLYPGDRIVLLGEAENLSKAVTFMTQREFGSPDQENTFTIASVEVPTSCEISGKSLAELNFRKDFGVTVIGIERGDEKIGRITADTAVQEKDLLIVAGCRRAINDLEAALANECRRSH